MKRAAIISSTATPRHVMHELRQRLAYPFPKSFIRTGECELCLEYGSPAVQEALDIIRQYDSRPHLFSHVYYTSKELKEVSYFSMRQPDPLELCGGSAKWYGTRYTGGCPVCGLGKKTVGDVLVDRKYMHRFTYEMGELNPHFFVTERLRKIIEGTGFTGITFGQEIRDYKGRDMEPYYIVEIPHVLPPMSASVIAEPVEQLSCGHYETWYLRSDPQYEAEKLSDACDFNLTAEHINNFRMPQVIVSARVWRVLKQHKLKNRFEPVTIL